MCGSGIPWSVRPCTGRRAARDRRAAHDALAAATDPGTDPDRRAWHRAHATAGPDETVAGELIGSAGRALRRGGVAAAAAFWERAVVLTPDPGERAARALEAAGAKYAGGRLRGRAGPAGRGRGRAARASSTTRSYSGCGPRSRSRSGEAATRRRCCSGRRSGWRTLDAELARQTYLEALVAAVYVGRLAHGQDVLEIARAARLGADRAGARREPRAQAAAAAARPGGAASRRVPGRRSPAQRGAAPRTGPSRRSWTGCASPYNMVAMDLWDDQALVRARHRPGPAGPRERHAELAPVRARLPRRDPDPGRRAVRGGGPAGGGRAHRPGEQGGHPAVRLAAARRVARGRAGRRRADRGRWSRAPATGARARR